MLGCIEKAHANNALDRSLPPSLSLSLSMSLLYAEPFCSLVAKAALSSLRRSN